MTWQSDPSARSMCIRCQIRLHPKHRLAECSRALGVGSLWTLLPLLHSTFPDRMDPLVSGYEVSLLTRSFLLASV